MQRDSEPGCPEDFAKWQPASGTPLFEPRGAILHGDGNGQLATIQTYRDFILHLYIRGVQNHNGGVTFRSAPKSASSPPCLRSARHERAG